MPVPRLRDDVRIDRLDDGVVRITDRAGVELFRLSDEGLWLLLRMDGAGEPAALLAEHRERFGGDMGPEDLEGWIAGLRDAGVLVEDPRAAVILPWLAERGFVARRPGQRGPARDEAREPDNANRGLWFDRAVFLLNDGDVEGALEIFAAIAEEDPGDLRVGGLVRDLQQLIHRGLPGDAPRDRRDPTWRLFDEVLGRMLAEGRCPRCEASLDLQPGPNRCWACGASFTTWLLDHRVEQRRG